MVFAHRDVKNSDSRVTMKPFKMDNFATERKGEGNLGARHSLEAKGKMLEFITMRKKEEEEKKEQIRTFTTIFAMVDPFSS